MIQYRWNRSNFRDGNHCSQSSHHGILSHNYERHAVFMRLLIWILMAHQHTIWLLPWNCHRSEKKRQRIDDGKFCQKLWGCLKWNGTEWYCDSSIFWTCSFFTFFLRKWNDRNVERDKLVSGMSWSEREALMHTHTHTLAHMQTESVQFEFEQICTQAQLSDKNQCFQGVDASNSEIYCVRAWGLPFVLLNQSVIIL